MPVNGFFFFVNFQIVNEIFFVSFCRLGTISNTKKSRLEVPAATTNSTKVAKRNLLVEYNKEAVTFAKPKTSTAPRKSPFKRVISMMTQPTAILRRRVCFNFSIRCGNRPF